MFIALIYEDMFRSVRSGMARNIALLTERSFIFRIGL